MTSFPKFNLLLASDGVLFLFLHHKVLQKPQRRHLSINCNENLKIYS